jgi:monoamine oxidase
MPHHSLHIVGEHTPRMEVGMDGAMEGGERVALEIVIAASVSN